MELSHEQIESKRHNSFSDAIKQIKKETKKWKYIMQSETGSNEKLNYDHLIPAIERCYAFVVTNSRDLYFYDYDENIYCEYDDILNQIHRKVIVKAPTRNSMLTIRDALIASKYAFKETKLSNNEIPVRNGILNRETKELDVYDITKFVRYKLNVEYKPCVDYPDGVYDIDQFLLDTANQKESRLKGLMQVINYAISGINPHHNIVMFLGEGGSGKSALNKLIKSFVGDQYHAALKLSQFNEDKYLSTLRNKVVSIGDDLGDGQYIGDIENLKSLSAKDSVTVDIKHKKGIELTFPGMIIQNAARIPKFSESGEQLKRRLRVYHFQNKFTGVHNKLSNEEFNNMIHNEDVKSYLLNHLLTIDINEELVGCDELLLEEATSINDDYQSFASSIRYTKLMTLDYIPQSVLKAVYFDYNDYKLRDKNKISSGKLISLMKPHMEKLGYQYDNKVVKRPKACVKDVQILEDIDETMNDAAVQKIFNDNDMQEEAYSFELNDNDYPNYTSTMRKNIPSKCWVKVE